MSDALNSLLREVRDALYADQPYLEVEIQDRKVVVEGTYLLVAALEGYRDRGPLAEYRLRIAIPADYPATEPEVRMLDRSVPRNAAHHCASNGVCCITVFEAWAASSSDISIGAYFQIPFRNYFLGQLLKRSGKGWPFDEWGHGIDGWIAAVAELIGCRARKTEVRKVLTWRASGRDLDIAGCCPCGSGRTASECCGDRLQGFMHVVPPEVAEAWLGRLSSMMAQRTPLEIKREIHKNRPFNRVH